jgi:hypothetical protein
MSELYEKLKLEKITNVGELISKLKKLPRNTPIYVTNADVGGYDVTTHPHCFIEKYDDGITFEHKEYELNKAMEKGIITEQEYKSIIKE